MAVNDKAGAPCDVSPSLAVTRHVMLWGMTESWGMTEISVSDGVSATKFRAGSRHRRHFGASGRCDAPVTGRVK